MSQKRVRRIERSKTYKEENERKGSVLRKMSLKLKRKMPTNAKSGGKNVMKSC